jgi:hypothetical protein
MKRWLQAGLVPMALMVAFLWWRAQPPRQMPGRQGSPTDAPAVNPRSWPRPSFSPSPAEAPVRTLWAEIDSGGPEGLVAHLREIGCPEQTIREIITFRVCREYHNRLCDLETEEARSWDYAQNYDAFTIQEHRQEREDLRNALDAELERLLGVSSRVLKASVTGWVESEDSYDFLPLAKQAPVRALEQRYRALAQDAKRGLLSWDSDPVVDARLQELDQQKQAELSTLLTPQELEGLRLRASPAARYALQYLPEAQSEAEFREMVHAVEEVGVEAPKADPFPIRFGLPPNPLLPDSTEADDRQARKETRLRARLKALLGERRLAEFEQQPAR